MKLKQHREKQNRKQGIFIVVSLFLAIIVLVSAICLHESHYSHAGESHALEAIRGLNGRGVIESVEDTDGLQQRQEMFEEGRARYPEMIGWLMIPGTVIDYPVMHSEDNSYYVNHSYDQKVDFYGTPFLDSQNAANFSDFFSIVYAHRMNNGTMFGTLPMFQEEEPFQHTQEGILFLPDGKHTLTIIASFSVDEEIQVLMEKLASGESPLEERLEPLLQHARQRRTVEVTASDQLVALFTLEDTDDAESGVLPTMLLAKIEPIQDDAA